LRDERTKGQKQIPFGNDKQKGNGNGNGKSKMQMQMQMQIRPPSTSSG
jgi:hypothetical protein